MLMPSLRLLSVYTACLVVCGCADSPPPDPDPNADKTAESVTLLRGFIGRDLQDSSSADLQLIRQALHQLDPDRPDEYRRPSLSPRYVWAFGGDDQPSGLLVLDAETGRDHPGATKLRLTAFDATGGIRARAEFTTGWRRYLKAARLVPFAEGIEPAVAIEALENLGPSVGTDYYVLASGRFDLIRIDRPDWPDARNNYYVRHFARGPAPPVQGADEWETDLCSGDRARVLRALVWLGGRHGPIRQGNEATDEQYESAAEIELVRTVRARPAVIKRLGTLVESDDQWLREAARLAAQPDDATR